MSGWRCKADVLFFALALPKLGRLRPVFSKAQAPLGEAQILESGLGLADDARLADAAWSAQSKFALALAADLMPNTILGVSLAAAIMSCLPSFFCVSYLRDCLNQGVHVQSLFASML